MNNKDKVNIFNMLYSGEGLGELSVNKQEFDIILNKNERKYR
jgi:hypothetical protein